MFCWLNQRRISSRIDDRAPLTGALQQHVSHCAACRSHWESELRVASQLRAPATRDDNAPEFLHGGIMAAIRNSERDEASTHIPRFATAVAIIAIVSAFSIWRFRQSDGQSTKPAAPLAAAADALPGPISVPPVAVAALTERIEQPLATEADAVVADAKAALRTLAQNFVPADWQTDRISAGDE